MQRKLHYWNWLLIFGISAALIQYRTSYPHTLNSEVIWMTLTGLVGVISIAKQYDKIAKPFDIVGGFFFAIIGLLGILHNLGLDLIGTGLLVKAIHQQSILGLSLCPYPALIHTAVGCVSISHGFYVSAPKPTVAVSSG